MRKQTQQYITIKRDDLRFQVRVIKSQHALMTDRQYTRHAVCMAESYGHATPFGCGAVTMRRRSSWRAWLHVGLKKFCRNEFFS